MASGGARESLWSHFVATSSVEDERRGVPPVRVALRVATLMCAFFALDWWIGAVSHLDASRYRGMTITGGILASLFRPQTAVPLIALLVVGLTRPIGLRWDAIEHGRELRRFVTLVTFLLAWVFSTYDYNFFFDQGHYLDRILLWVLAALVIVRPVFVLPFLLLVVAVAWQFYYPIGGYSVAQPFLLVRALTLFAAVFFLMAVGGGRNPVDFVFCGLSLLAASYFTAGLGKIRLAWVTYGHLYHLIPTTYANGWLGFVEPATLSSVVRVVSWLDWPLRLVALTLECGAILFLLRRRLALVLLAGWTLFHLGVFAFSGICFWMWMTVDVALLVFFWSRERACRFPVFTPVRFVLSIVLVGGGALWFRPVNLSWYDARTTYTYRYHGVGESGRRYHLPPSFFAPYDYQFTIGGFAYVVDAPVLDVVWGATFDRATAERLLACEGPTEILELEAELGDLRFDRARAEKLDDFVARFVENVEARGGKHHWWRWLRAPPQLWTLSRVVPFWEDGDPIVQVRVTQVTSDWNGDAYAEIRERVVRTIRVR